MRPHKWMDAYLAGFIDGEGSLTVTRHTRKDRPGYRRFNVRLAVYNTNLSLLYTLQGLFGGKVMIARRRNPKWKDQGQLCWSEEQVIAVLQRVRPYLILKAEQADILLSLQDSKMEASQGRRNGLPNNVVEFREKAYSQLKKLNHRGRSS